MKYLTLAIGFLTIIPVRRTETPPPERFGRAVIAFPVVGLLLGLLLSAAAVPLTFLFPPTLSAALILLLSTLLTGGFHLDALADTFDAIALKSTGNVGADRERRLAVMRDSTSGAIGITALVLVLLVKYGALVVILDGTAFAWSRMAPLLMLWPTFGRWAMVPAMVRGRAARSDGLGKLLLDQAGPAQFFGALMTLIASGATAALFWGRTAPADGFFFFVGGLAVMAYLIAEIVHRLADRLFGGLTGDVLGTVNELTEVACLVMVTAWLPHSI